MDLYIIDHGMLFAPDALHMTCASLASDIGRGMLSGRKWNNVFIDLADCLDSVTLSCLKDNFTNIQVRYDGELNEHKISLLCALYPNETGVIRNSYLSNGGQVHGLLPGVWGYPH